MGDRGVTIIGAGIIGASIAYELASRGARVTVLDSRPSGQGATQAAAGMLVPYLEGVGRPILPMAVRSLEMYDDFVNRITKDAGIPVDYRRDGSLQLARAEEVERLKAEYAAISSQSVPCMLLDAMQVREAEPLVTPDIAAGLLIPQHGVVSPVSLSYALTAAAMKRGARFKTSDDQVLRIAPNGSGFALEAKHETFTAEQVVLAAGSWSAHVAIAGVPPLPVRPVRGQLVNVISDGARLRRIVWGTGCYIAPYTDGMLGVGATVEEAGFDERATVAGVRDLLDAAADMVPALWKSSFAGARVGLRPATPDEMPIMGRSAKFPGLIYATGHFRNGILLAPLTGRLIADLLLDDRRDSLLMAASPQRFGEY